MAFVWEVVKANPGVTGGGSIHVFQAHWADITRQLLDFPLDMFLNEGPAVAYLELRAALVLILIHEGVGGFAMATEAPVYLTKIMIPYFFRVKWVEKLVTAANQFIRKMRTDTPYWHDVPFFRTSAIRPWEQSRSESESAFCAILGTFALNTRAHFFDAFGSEHDRNRSKSLALVTSYETRKRGLDADQSASEILASGLLQRSSDIREFLYGLPRKKLIDLLEIGGIKFRGTESVVSLVDVLIERCPILLAESMEKANITEVIVEYRNAVAWAREEIKRTQQFFRLWLGFAIRGTSK